MQNIKEICEICDQFSAQILKASEEIWNFSELYFKETKSAQTLANLAQEEGFEIKMGLCSIPTAFVAKWGTEGPKIGILAEYDALPGLSQEAGCLHKKPVSGKTEADAGHGCGHNCLGAGALGAALAIKTYCQKHDIKAQIFLFGCPAEENGSGKVFMARDGIFDGLDFCLTWHPADENSVIGTGCLANFSAKFIFHGVTSHAAATPHLGRSALDACELMNMGVNYLREHIIPQARIHYSYLDAGTKAPNVVPDYACTYFFIRAPKVSQAFEITQRVYDIAKGAALMTGTNVEIIPMDGISDYVPNKTLGTLMAQTFCEIGIPSWTKEDLQLAKSYSNTFSAQQILDAKTACANATGLSLQEYENLVLDQFIAPYMHAPDKVMPGSTDVGDVSYCVPTAQCNVATCALGTPGHSWQMTSQGNTSLAHKGTIHAAKVMAATAIKALLNPEIIEKAKQEHKANVPQGYTCPTPVDFKPDLE